MDDRTQPTPDPTHDTWSAYLPDLDPAAPERATPSEAPGVPGASLPHVPPPPVASTPPPTYAVSPAPVPGSTYGAWAVAPPTRLGWAIVCTIFCFMPFGVVAVLKAAQVNTKWAQGDWDGAHQLSRSAKTWCLLAAAVWPGGFFLLSCGTMLAGGSVSVHL